MSNISISNFTGLSEEALSIILLQNFSAQLERDILSSGNRLQVLFFYLGARLVHLMYYLLFVPLHNLHLKLYHWNDQSLVCGAELNKKTRGITRTE